MWVQIAFSVFQIVYLISYCSIKIMTEKHVACALLIDTQGHICIQKRDGISKYGEEWSFFGWKIENDETPYQALVREMSEEIGLDITSWEIASLWVVQHDLVDFDIRYFRHLFAIHMPADILTLSDHEGAGAFSFRIQDIPSLKFNTSTIEEITTLKKYIKWYKYAIQSDFL